MKYLFYLMLMACGMPVAQLDAAVEDDSAVVTDAVVHSAQADVVVADAVSDAPQGHLTLRARVTCTPALAGCSQDYDITVPYGNYICRHGVNAEGRAPGPWVSASGWLATQSIVDNIGLLDFALGPPVNGVYSQTYFSIQHSNNNLEYAWGAGEYFADLWGYGIPTPYCGVSSFTSDLRTTPGMIHFQGRMACTHSATVPQAGWWMAQTELGVIGPPATGVNRAMSLSFDCPLVSQ